MHEGLHPQNQPPQMPPPKFTAFEGNQEAKDEKKKNPIEQKQFDVFPTPKEKIEPAEREKALEMVRKNVVENEALFSLYAKGLSGSNTTNLARFRNFITKECIDLSDTEIDSVMRQLTMNFNRWYALHKDEFAISKSDEEALTKVGRHLNSLGIKTAVRYIEARNKQLSKESSNYVFAFDNYLDSHYKIDVIELFYNTTETGVLEVSEMNLVQIKGGVASDDEIESIVTDHKAWALTRMLGLEKLKEIKSGAVDKEKVARLQEFFRDKNIVQEALIDIMTSDAVFDEKLLISKLGLDTASNAERYAVLLSRMKDFADILSSLAEEGYADEEWSGRLRSAYSLLLESTGAKANSGIPAKAAPIRTINSVIVSNGRVVRKESIYTRPSETEVGKFVAYS